MSQPGTGDVHVNALLTNMSIGYINEIYIANQIFPIVLTRKQSDIIAKYDKSHFYRLRAKTLSDREAAPVSGYTVDTSNTYFSVEHGTGHFISDARRANTDQPFQADLDGMRFALDGMMLQQEYDFVTDFWKTGVWGLDRTGTVDFTKWSTYATSTPLHDLREFIRLVRRACGRQPTQLTLGDLTWDVLQDHPVMLDRIKYGQMAGSPASVSLNLLAQLLELDQVLVGRAQYTTDPEGTAEASVTYNAMWDDDALLTFTTNAPSLFTPTAGYNFTWSTAFGGPRYVKQRRDPMSDKGDLIEVYEFYDQKITSASSGLFMSDAVD